MELAAIGMESSNLVSSNGARDRLNCQLYSPDIYIYILIHTHMEPDGHHKLVTHTHIHTWHGIPCDWIELDIYRQKTLTQLDSSHRIRVCLSHCPDQS